MYKQMYVTLFKAVTAALYMIEDNEVMKARALMMWAQQETEELYIGWGEESCGAQTRGVDRWDG